MDDEIENRRGKPQSSLAISIGIGIGIGIGIDQDNMISFWQIAIQHLKIGCLFQDFVRGTHPCAANCEAKVREKPSDQLKVGVAKSKIQKT